MKLLICTQTVDKNDPILGFFVGWILEFAKHFSEVHIICLKKGSYELPPHVFIYSLGKEEGESRLKYLYRFYNYFGHIFFKVKVDYVFFHMTEINVLLAAPFYLVRKFYKTKFYWWKTHGHINRKAKVALNFVDKVYTAVEASFSIKTKKRNVIGHAIDTSLFKFTNKTRNPYSILFVGRLMPSKRVEQVITIVSELSKFGFPIELKIIGTAPDKDYLDMLKSMVIKNNLESSVTFVGSLNHNQLPNEYQSSNIFINPSDNDGLDKVVLEAMLCGALPLTANLSFEDLLKPFNLYMKKGDISGYVDRIKELISLNAEVRMKMAQTLHNEVANNHSLTTLTTRVFNI